jgi:hypothetical protein
VNSEQGTAIEEGRTMDNGQMTMDNEDERVLYE